uniref:Nucleotide binding protein like n=1 Tax=Pseudonaja textilis TaxID=8673 RepID=A0A670XWG9_PSETE
MSLLCLCSKDAYWALKKFAFLILRRSGGENLHPYSNADAVSCMHPSTADGALEDKRSKIMARGLPKQKPIEGVKQVLLVASGKGGVGKSTTAGKLFILY